LGSKTNIRCQIKVFLEQNTFVLARLEVIACQLTSIVLQLTTQTRQNTLLPTLARCFWNNLKSFDRGLKKLCQPAKRFPKAALL